MNGCRQLLTLLFLSPVVAMRPAHADELSFSGNAGAEHAYGFSAGTSVLSRQHAYLAMSRESEKCELKISLRLRHETKLSEAGRTERELRAGTVTCRWRDWLVSAGRQSVAWGKADGL